MIKKERGGHKALNEAKDVLPKLHREINPVHRHFSDSRKGADNDKALNSEAKNCTESNSFKGAFVLHGADSKNE